MTEISSYSPVSLSRAVSDSQIQCQSQKPSDLRSIWNDEASSAAHLLQVQHNGVLAPMISGIQALVSSHWTPLLWQDRTVPFLWSFLFGLVWFWWVFFHLQAQIAKEGSNWLIDYLPLLNESPFKEMSLSLSRQSHHLIACWFAVGNHLNRYSSWKSPVYCFAAAQMKHCFALSSLTLCSIPVGVQRMGKRPTEKFLKVSDIISWPLIIAGFQPSCAGNMVCQFGQAIASIGTSWPYLV